MGSTAIVIRDTQYFQVKERFKTIRKSGFAELNGKRTRERTTTLKVPRDYPDGRVRELGAVPKTVICKMEKIYGFERPAILLAEWLLGKDKENKDRAIAFTLCMRRVNVLPNDVVRKIIDIFCK